MTDSKRKVKLTYFKESGKYYTDEVIEVSRDLNAYQIFSQIESGEIDHSCNDLKFTLVEAFDPCDNVLYPQLLIKKR